MSETLPNLIFDRTQAKGQYNASDLNRVESWCNYLATTLNSYNYSITITTKTDWTASDMRTQSQMERIRKNILKIMTGFHYLTQIKPNAEFFDYAKANNWEQILYEINSLMEGMINYNVYCGVANCGQNRLWQNRFRHFSREKFNFSSSIIPTEWTSITNITFYSITSNGYWKTTSGTITSGHPSYLAIDGVNDTYWESGTQTAETGNAIEITCPIAIKPTKIFVRYARLGSGSVVQGFNEATNEWDDLGTPTFNHENITVNTLYPITNNFYKKFRFKTMKLNNQYARSYIYVFEIQEGQFYK